MDKTKYLKYILVEIKNEGSISCLSVLSNLLDVLVVLEFCYYNLGYLVFYTES